MSPRENYKELLPGENSFLFEEEGQWGEDHSPPTTFLSNHRSEQESRDLAGARSQGFTRECLDHSSTEGSRKPQGVKEKALGREPKTGFFLPSWPLTHSRILEKSLSL